jgi:hypothetical protein
MPKQILGHDDWHCVEDLQRANLLHIKGTGLHPFFAMTPLGLQVAAALRAFKAQGGTFSTFDPLTPTPTFQQRHSAIQKAHVVEHESKKKARCVYERN